MSRVADIVRFVTAAETRTDGELLAAFRLHRDEPAFAELVRRHGPLVWGVCRRHLPDHADAEDAFQASFLVLVRRANGLTSRGTLGPWLYRVAAWTARNLRRKNARRLARTAPLAEPVPFLPPEADSRLDVDAALLALPERYRDPIILCHLEGLSRRDAAERLGCPEGTLSSLLSRGLAKLRARLAGHEFAVVAAPALLAGSTVRAACATRAALAGAVPASATQLMEGVLRMLWIKKTAAAMTAMAVVFALGIAIGSTARTGTVAAGDEKPAARPKAAGVAADLSSVDVTIGGKELGYPLDVGECDRDGARIGVARIEPQAMLVRYLARARVDPNGPKRLRLNAWTDAPHDEIKATLRSCQAAGYKEAIFHGRMPTNDPDIRFTPPVNDPGGKRDGWFEADEVLIKFDDLLKPLAKPKP